jgi:hypothetical protein
MTTLSQSKCALLRGPGSRYRMLLSTRLVRRGPKRVVRQTLVLKADLVGTLLDSIKTGSIVGLRDRAIMGLRALPLRPSFQSPA